MFKKMAKKILNEIGYDIRRIRPNAPDHSPINTNTPFRKENTGYCHCCRNDVYFRSDESWLRDHYRCSVCHSIPRQRHLQLTLDRYFPEWEHKKIHESSPSNNFISRYSGVNYSCSQFFDFIQIGQYYQDTRSENLEKLTFADETFDIFITQDVFEHIFNPDLASKEIMRVLRSGGAHVFTAPKHKSLKVSCPRATLVDGTVKHLKDEQYHGNPIGDGRSLVTWDYGDDFEFLLHKWCGFPTVTYVVRDEKLGIDGEYLEVFVTRKI
jgi:SAM-dependent methyltransferase